jgi:hypothetical protein
LSMHRGRGIGGPRSPQPEVWKLIPLLSSVGPCHLTGRPPLLRSSWPGCVFVNTRKQIGRLHEGHAPLAWSSLASTDTLTQPAGSTSRRAATTSGAHFRRDTHCSRASAGRSYPREPPAPLSQDARRQPTSHRPGSVFFERRAAGHWLPMRSSSFSHPTPVDRSLTRRRGRPRSLPRGSSAAGQDGCYA